MIRAHVREYGFPFEALRDPGHALVARAKATVTPESAVFARGGALVYHGRIDDRNIDFGEARPEPTRRDLEEALDAVLAGRAPRETEAPAIGCAIAAAKLTRPRPTRGRRARSGSADRSARSRAPGETDRSPRARVPRLGERRGRGSREPSACRGRRRRPRGTPRGRPACSPSPRARARGSRARRRTAGSRSAPRGTRAIAPSSVPLRHLEVRQVEVRGRRAPGPLRSRACSDAIASSDPAVVGERVREVVLIARRVVRCGEAARSSAMRRRTSPRASCGRTSNVMFPISSVDFSPVRHALRRMARVARVPLGVVVDEAPSRSRSPPGARRGSAYVYLSCQLKSQSSIRGAASPCRRAASPSSASSGPGSARAGTG